MVSAAWLTVSKLPFLPLALPPQPPVCHQKRSAEDNAASEASSPHYTPSADSDSGNKHVTEIDPFPEVGKIQLTLRNSASQYLLRLL